MPTPGGSSPASEVARKPSPRLLREVSSLSRSWKRGSAPETQTRHTGVRRGVRGPARPVLPGGVCGRGSAGTALGGLRARVCGEPTVWAPLCDRLVARVTTCSGALSAGGLPDLDREQVRVGASREAPPGKRGPSWGPGRTGSHRCKHFTPKQVRELKTTPPQACPAASVTHCTKGPSRGPLRSKTLGL